MATTTARLGLRQPEDVVGGTDDFIDVTTDISDSMSKIDDAVGANRGTSFPVSPFLGQLFVRNDQGERLYYWTGTQWLIMANGPYFQATGTNTTIPANTLTPVPLATEVVDTDNGHDIVTNNSRYTAPFKGLYDINVTVAWNNKSEDTIRELGVRFNGSTHYRLQRYGAILDILYHQSGSIQLPLNAGQYVEMVVEHNHTADALTLSTSGSTPRMDVAFIRSLA